MVRPQLALATELPCATGRFLKMDKQSRLFFAFAGAALLAGCTDSSARGVPNGGADAGGDRGAPAAAGISGRVEVGDGGAPAASAGISGKVEVGEGGAPGIGGSAGGALSGGTGGEAGGRANSGGPGAGMGSSGTVETGGGGGGAGVPLDPCAGIMCKWGTTCAAGECVLPACSGNLGLPAPTPPAAGKGPVSAVVADLDGDGQLDLAVANRDSNDVSVLIGRGDGRFAAPVSYATGLAPRSIVAADLNGDGKLDLVTANAASGDLSVFVGQGAGQFGTPTSYETPPGALSVAVGDLNGDGKPDLAIATLDAGNSRVSTLINRGDGSFFKATRYLVTGTLSSLAMADLDGDGKMDLAVSRSDSQSYLQKNTVSVLFNAGDGSFTSPREFDSGSVSHFVLVADLNDDGRPDLALANYEGSEQGAPPNVSVLLNLGGQNFSVPVSYDVGPHPQAIVARDLNNDGKLDLAIAHAGSDHITTLLNLGRGVFQAASSIAIYSWVELDFTLGAGDFNGDGSVDLVTTDSRDIAIWLNRGAAFDMPTSYSGGWHYFYSTSANAVAAGDLNGDDKPDIAVGGGDGDIGLLFNRGDGTFAAATKFSAGQTPQAIAIGDLNGDGKPDLATADHNSSDVSVLLNAGRGTFATTLHYPAGEGAKSLAMSDLDGDGKFDLVVGHYSTGIVSVLINRGHDFAPFTNYTAGKGSNSVALGDLNGDGKPDLAVTSQESNDVGVLINQGDGMFSAGVSYAVGLSPEALVLADVDTNGTLDVLVVNRGSDSASVLLNSGAGVLLPAVEYRTGKWPFAITMGDLNGDHKPDLIVANLYSADLSVLLNTGDGTFSASARYAPGFDYRALAVSDFNGDGRPDIAVADGDNVDVLWNRCLRESK